jgi:site-specific recombinase XerC
VTDRTKAALSFLSVSVQVGSSLHHAILECRSRQSLFPRHGARPRKAGVSDDVDLYAARHVFGTDLMTATKNPFLVSRMMGHTDLATTNRYQHYEADGIAALMNQRNRGRELCHIPRRSQQMVR